MLLAVFCLAQQTTLQQIDSLLSKRETSEALYYLQSIDTGSLKKPDKAEFYYLLGYAENFDNRADESFRHLLESRKKFRELGSFGKVANINLLIVQSLNSLQNPNLNPKPFMDEYLQYARDQNSPELLSKAYMQLGKIFINSNPKETIDFFTLALNENQKAGDSLMQAKIHHNLGAVYGEHLVDKDAALVHYNMALKHYQKEDLKDYIAYIYNNKASLFKNLEQYDSAIFYYQKADSMSAKEYTRGNKAFLYANMAETYELNKDFEKAFKFLKLKNAFEDSLSQDEQDKTLLDLQTRYEVEKKENENLKLKQNRTWLLIGIAALLLLLLIGYLSYRNLHNKKKLTEREADIHRERLEKVLKNQELAGIDAMIEGQEKERQRIANDLHDHLGSLLATLKLHFQNLKVKKDRLKEEEDKILQQTDNLIDEAYRQVRNMAHLKNAGLKAQEGLIPAIKNFASKVSTSNQLVIKVEDHGMEERLENSLEILIFRVIQELITNIIKHASATESFIHLTHHGEVINIMVEDNGKGFNLKKMKPKKGMGIYSIQKRIENIDGKVEIESIPDNGTTIIIDIPVK